MNLDITAKATPADKGTRHERHDVETIVRKIKNVVEENDGNLSIDDLKAEGVSEADLKRLLEHIEHSNRPSEFLGESINYSTWTEFLGEPTKSS